MTDLPIVGAALTLPGLKTHLDLILEKNRDLEIQDFISADLLDGDWRPRVDEIRALLAPYTGRLGIHGPFWGFSIASPDPAIRAVVTRRLLQGLEICEALGATQMVIHSPFTTWGAHNAPFFDPGNARAIALCHETLADPVRRASDIGCELVIENIEDRNPGDRVALAASFDTPVVGVSLDTGHAHYAHGATGAPPVDAHVLAAGNLLRHVHLQDADGYADRHWSLGLGTVNFPAIFAALTRLTSQPRLILELRDQNDVPRSIRHLENLGLAQ